MRGALHSKNLYCSWKVWHIFFNMNRNGSIHYLLRYFLFPRSWYSSNIRCWESGFFAGRQYRATPDRHLWRVPYTFYQSIFSFSFSLIVHSIYLMYFDRCSFKSGGYTISRIVIRIQPNKSCVRCWSRCWWFRNPINFSKFNKVDLCKYSNESVIPPHY